MTLTEKQEKGLEIAVERYKRGERYSVISGYAGSGKTVLVKFIISRLIAEDPELSLEDVVYTAFTGKACNVLQQKGNQNVSTLHHLLYKYIPLKNGGFRRTPVDDISYKIVVIDECSMASKELVQQLFRYDVYVLALGDPFQLPCINPQDDNHLLDNPHIFLDEVMRQALESDIIKVSMDIRGNKLLRPYDGKDIKIFNKKELTEGMLLWADQIISATNATRMNINFLMRQLLGYSGDMPQEGEKVICLRNEWDCIDEQDNPLVNGTIGYLKNIYTQALTLPLSIGNGLSFDVICADVETEIGTIFKDLIIDKQLFLTGKPSLTPQIQYSLRRSKKFNWMLPMAFTYGYCVSCHKFQGSQADKVLVLEEKFPFANEEHQRWLYTACTRAINKCVIIKKE